MAIQCCVCYRVKEVRESEVTWKKVRDAAIVSRTAKLVFCPECEHKFRARYDLLPSRNKASRKRALKKAG